jgi:thymidylate kinase
MKGLIIVDGCDGTGKTTLAKAICERFNGIYMHNTYRWPTKMPLYHTAALHRALKLAKTRLVVIDRLWMSEAIYAEVYRGGSSWPHMGRMIDRIVRKHAGLYILTLSPEGHKERFDKLKTEREEMYDNVEAVRIRYDELFHGGFAMHDRDYAQQLSVHGMKDRHDVLGYRLDVEGTDIPQFLSFVEAALMERQMSQYEPALHLHTKNFAGHLGDADTIIVGDQTNSKMRALEWPWYDIGNSSLFLSECLHDLHFDETRAVYINANSGNGGLYIGDCLRHSPYMKLVVLGQLAFDTVKHLRMDRTAVRCMHPSAAKRFNKRDEFMQELKGALK